MNCLRLLRLSLLLWALISCSREEAGKQRNTLTAADSAAIEKKIHAAKNISDNSPDSMLLLSRQLVSFGAKSNRAAAEAEILKAKYHWRTGARKTAMTAALKALRMVNRSLPEKLPAVYAIIGNLHKEQGNYKMALESAANGLAVAQRLKDTTNIIYMLRLQAMFTKAYGADHNDSTAIRKSLRLHMQGLKLAESNLKYESSRIAYYDNISQYYAERGNFEKAVYYGGKSVPLCYKYNRKTSLTYAYNWLGMAYFKHGDTRTGLDYIYKALSISREIHNPFREMELNLALYNCYLDAGQYKPAMMNFSRYNSIRDSLNVLNNTRQIAELHLQYETDKKNHQISLLEKLNRSQSFIVTGLIIGIVVVLLLSGLLLRLYRAIKQRNRQITEQSDKLEVLMKELHHRVKNNLQVVSSLLNLQSNRLTDPQAKQSVLVGKQRIETMALIHGSLYRQENISMVNMNEYVRNVVESVIKSFGKEENVIDLHITVEVPELDMDQALPLGLIINEWVTNVLKHAYTDTEMPSLVLDLKSEDSKFKLTIKDNGVGMDEEKWHQPGNSFGIKLIKVLSKQLKGNCSMEQGSGTRLNVIF